LGTETHPVASGLGHWLRVVTARTRRKSAGMERGGSSHLAEQELRERLDHGDRLLHGVALLPIPRVEPILDGVVRAVRARHEHPHPHILDLEAEGHEEVLDETSRLVVAPEEGATTSDVAEQPRATVGLAYDVGRGLDQALGPAGRRRPNGQRPIVHAHGEIARPHLIT